MKNNRQSRALSVFLLLAFVCQLGSFAAAAEEPDTVYLNNANAVRSFAEHCAYDAWSEGKTVILQCDIALGGVDFLPAASFGGVFEGGGHTISGLNVSSNVSPAGLFGTIAESGVVRGLTVAGSVAPGGSADVVGGIAGINRGAIEDCAFVGSVSGEKRTGGIVGENAASGTILRCSVNGGIFGKNMTGGVVGANHGTVSQCRNTAYVNTDSIDPSLSFDKVDVSLANGLGSLASPDVYNVTVDSGGVAGFSDGVLLGCVNAGSVGYQHIGYNVGGVVGRSSGHVSGCVNEGSVYGRREVGGVAGMAEPYVKMNVSESELDRVRHELNALSALIEQTVDDAQDASDTVAARLNAMNESVDEAQKSAKALTDRLGDYWDGVIEEIDRGSGIVDVVLPQLRDVAGELTETSEAMTEAVALLEKTIGEIELPDGVDGEVFAELSAMAGELRTASELLGSGTRQLENALATLERTVGPRDGMSEAQWRDLVYGAVGPNGRRTGGALADVSAGLRETAGALGDIASIVGGLSTLVTGGAEEIKRNAETLYPDEPVERAAYIAVEADKLLLHAVPAYILEHPLDEPLLAAGEGMRKTEAALALLDNSTQLYPENLYDGVAGLRAGLRILSDGYGSGGVFDHLASAFGHLQNASNAAQELTESAQRDVEKAQKPLDDLEKTVAALRDVSNKLTGAFDSTRKLLDYLAAQDKLNFETLGEETDASADALYDAMHGISDNLELLNQETKSAADKVLDDVRKINRQFTSLMNTLLDLVEERENVSASSLIEDTSDQEVEEAMQGKLLLCRNSGEISGDIDVGGIAGAMMIYNELDPESDGDTLASAFHKSYELKCILQDCVNTGAVTGKRDNIAAICGSATLGAISGCEAYGSVTSDGGDCVGGVAGYGDNTVRRCWARCALAGGKNVGGIVGAGRAERSNLRVEDCRSLVEVTSSTQYAGAILGSEAGSLSGNLFVSDTLAGVDRVSVRGKAEPVEYAQLLAIAGLPEAFRSFMLTFVADGETIRATPFRYGQSFDESAFPAIPARDGQFGRWDRTELTNLRFDTTVNAVYEPCVSALSSDVTRSASRPTFFVEGAFNDAAVMEAAPAIFDFDDGGGQDLLARLRSYRKTLLEQWQLTLPSDGAPTHVVRYLPPDGVADHIELYVPDGGAWRLVETQKMGSYLTFETDADTVSLSVVSTATPWWVWALVGGAAFFALALIVALLVRKKPKPALTEEEKKKEKKRRRHRIAVRIVLLALMLGLGGAAYAVLRSAPGLADSMSLYMLLHNYAERRDLDVELSVVANVNGKTFDADVEYFTTDCDDKRVSCVMWEDIPLYYCDGAMLLENGRAYRADGVLPDYSKLLSHVAGLYRAVEVTSSESNGVKNYHAVARGEAAEQILKVLLPDALPAVPETEAVELDLALIDGEPAGLQIGWNGEAGDAHAELGLADHSREHTLPQAVRTSIASGEYQKAGEIDAQLKQLILAWTELATRDPLSADVTLIADCGPLLLDESLTWQRVRMDGEELSCLTQRDARIYYTETAACTGSGVAVNRGGTSFRDTAKLLHLAYEAFLLGEASCREGGGVTAYTIRLDEAAMAEFAAAIAPETRTMGVSFTEGSVSLRLRSGAAESVTVQCRGTVRVVRMDVPATISARLTFGEKTFLMPSQKTLEALGLGG
ncbi:MAG: hypothetical protein IJU66_05885 [Oscillospiraceae bacterium]|nr:hypothetical protein [Oscillospiraceae bacterium]